jgi:hypothetical protein
MYCGTDVVVVLAAAGTVTEVVGAVIALDEEELLPEECFFRIVCDATNMATATTRTTIRMFLVRLFVSLPDGLSPRMVPPTCMTSSLTLVPH